MSKRRRLVIGISLCLFPDLMTKDRRRNMRVTPALSLLCVPWLISGIHSGQDFWEEMHILAPWVLPCFKIKEVKLSTAGAGNAGRSLGPSHRELQKSSQMQRELHGLFWKLGYRGVQFRICATPGGLQQLQFACLVRRKKRDCRGCKSHLGGLRGAPRIVGASLKIWNGA